MYRRFCEAMSQNGISHLLRQHGGVLTAYSGGADSTLLLHFLHQYCQENDLFLTCAHVHHGIRGTEADRDEAHCRKTAADCGIPLYVTHVDVPTLAKERSMGIEECARAVRYDWFDTVCRDLGKPLLPVATAHNGDDQLETVLFHLMRGTGLHGLVGIRPIREERFVRPLLSFSAPEIRAYCREAGYAYVEDGTNADTTYTRNYIRHQIVPAMENYQPALREAVLRMTSLAAREDDYLTVEATALLTSTRKAQNQYDLDTLSKAHPVLIARALRQAYERAVPAGSMTMEQTDTLVDWIMRGTGETKVICLPGGGKAEVSRNTVTFLSPYAPEEEANPLPVHTLAKEELFPDCDLFFPWEDGFVRLTRKKCPEVPEKAKNIYKLFIQQPMKFDTIKSILRMRTMAPGDTLRFGGMTRKLRKLYGERHISPAERKRALLLLDGEEILFAAGIPTCADKVRITDGTEEILWLEIYKTSDTPTI